MKDQQAREDIQNLFSQITQIYRIINEVEEKLNSKIEAVYTHNCITDLRKENAELKEKLNAKNK